MTEEKSTGPEIRAQEKLTLTWFRKCYVPTGGMIIEWTRDEFAARLARPKRHVGTKQSLWLYCPATFFDRHRRNASVEAVYMLGLDIDEPHRDPDACVRLISEALGSVEVFAHSTYHSAADAVKLRVFVPYDRAATADEHATSWRVAARVLSREGVSIDDKCKAPANGFFGWCIPPSGFYFHTHVAGDPLPLSHVDVEETARATTNARPLASTAFRGSLSHAERARRYVARMPPALSGAGGHAATFAVARRLVVDFTLDDETAWAILSEYSERCEPPWSERELRHKLESAKAARVRLSMGAAR